MLPRYLPGISTSMVAINFSLLPLVLKWAVEQTHHAPPELTHVTLSVGGERLRAVFLICMDVLKDRSGNDRMWRSLISETVVACAVAPLTPMPGHGTNRTIEISPLFSALQQIFPD